MQITILEGYDLIRLRELFRDNDLNIHTLRIHQGPEGIIYKVNEGCWSPPIGRKADAGGY